MKTPGPKPQKSPPKPPPPRVSRWQNAAGDWWLSCDLCLYAAWSELHGSHDCAGPHKMVYIVCPSISERALLCTFAKVEDEHHIVVKLTDDDLKVLTERVLEDQS